MIEHYRAHNSLRPSTICCTRRGYVRPERIVDGVLRKVGPVVFRCSFGKLRTGSYPGVHRWQRLCAKPWGQRPQPASLNAGAV
jgi:hypothetical protein